jgi:hypothetical protein
MPVCGDILASTMPVLADKAVIDRPVADELAMIDSTLSAGGAEPPATARWQNARTVVFSMWDQLCGLYAWPIANILFRDKILCSKFLLAGLDHELRPQGVTVTLHSAGCVSTAFADRAGFAEPIWWPAVEKRLV